MQVNVLTVCLDIKNKKIKYYYEHWFNIVSKFTTSSPYLKTKYMFLHFVLEI